MSSHSISNFNLKTSTTSNINYLYNMQALKLNTSQMIQNAMNMDKNILRQSFELFNKRGGKFRVAVVNRCNFNCSFCHNEGMMNPRPLNLTNTTFNRPSKSAYQYKGIHIEETSRIISLINTYCDMGGSSVNITGGEPLSRKDIVSLLENINKKKTKIILNSNISSPFVNRLLQHESKLETIDAIYASLHTTNNEEFGVSMGLPSNINYGADDVMRNMVALKKKGYQIEINFSLGNYNKHEFMNVLSFGISNEIPVKCIVLVKHDQKNKEFYNGKQSFINPEFIRGYLAKFECELVKTDKTKIGGYTDYYQTIKRIHTT